jgi:ATP-binding cassette, subfamily B, bacterial
LNIPVREYWALLVNYLKPQRLKVFLLAICLFANIGLQLINPQIMRSFIDSAIAGGAVEQLILLALLFFVFAVVQQVVSVLSVYVGQDVGWTATNGLRYDLARHLLYLGLSFHNQKKPGELIERVDGDVNALANFFSQFIVQVVGNAFFLLGILILLFREDWRVGAVMSVFAFITMLILMRLRNIGVPYWKAVSQTGAEFYGFLEERLAGTQDIRANGAKDYIMLRFYRLLRTWFHQQVKAALITNIMVNTIFLLIAISNAISFVMGASMFSSGLISLGTVYMIFHYTNLLTRPIDIITRQMDDLQKAGASITRAKELLQIQPKVTDGPGVELPAGALKVEFAGVTFGYDDDNEIVLQDINFCLEPGKVLGLLGRTGSGKTTMTRLLLRFYDPSQGAISLGDKDLRQMRQADLRHHVGMVTQNVQLFQATVRDNLTFFDPDIPDQKILDTLESLGLWAWYSSLPDGLDTKLSSGGGGLSAGEAQLLAFTRVFLKDPGLIILDEASSRLDPATEELIERAVDKLVKNRTAIIIAHRLGTVHRADQIMILDKGQILESGPRQQLANDPASRFHYLLETGLEEVLV